MIRPNGLFLAFALLLAIAATVLGPLAVPSEHHGESGAGHHEHSTQVAGHEGEDEKNDVLDAGEGLAALAVSVLAIALAPIGIRTSRSAEPPEVLRFAVAVASAGAATIHFAVIDQHLAEYWLFGVFFIAVALAQLGWVVAVVSNPTRTVYVVGALGNALIAVTWVISRTTGLPFGPGAGEPEPVGIADVVSTAFELAVVVGTVLLLLGLGVWRSSLKLTSPWLGHPDAERHPRERQCEGDREADCGPQSQGRSFAPCTTTESLRGRSDDRISIGDRDLIIDRGKLRRGSS